MRKVSLVEQRRWLGKLLHSYGSRCLPKQMLLVLLVSLRPKVLDQSDPDAKSFEVKVA